MYQPLRDSYLQPLPLPSLDIDVIGTLCHPHLIHGKTDHPFTLADPGLAPASEKTVPRAHTALT